MLREVVEQELEKRGGKAGVHAISSYKFFILQVCVQLGVSVLLSRLGRSRPPEPKDTQM